MDMWILLGYILVIALVLLNIRAGVLLRDLKKEDVGVTLENVDLVRWVKDRKNIRILSFMGVLMLAILGDFTLGFYGIIIGTYVIFGVVDAINMSKELERLGIDLGEDEN